jgi:O-methyltransferase
MSLLHEREAWWRRWRRRHKTRRPAVRDASPEAVAAVERALPYTMTSWERLLGVVEATEYVARHGVPGALVECGVWKGGSMLAAALTLVRLGVTDRDLYLFDTYEGLPKPGERDVTLTSGQAAVETWREVAEGDEASDWCRAGVEEVRGVMESSGYPKERIHTVVGMVERTVPARAPEEIALLRLDTDWYESTRHEMEHLWPRLAVGGVLILDDYGTWRGAREAVDEYLAAHRVPLLLQRLDKAGRMAVKIGCG